MEDLRVFISKISTWLLTCASVVSFAPSANALDCIRIGGLQFSTSGAFASVVSGHNYNDAYVSSFDYMYYSNPSYDIPPTFSYDGNTYTVDKIGLEAFRDGYVDNRNSSKIKHIFIPETIKKIGAGAFYGTSIRSMVIPASVQMFYSPGYSENWHSPFSKAGSYGDQYYNEDLDSLIYLGNTPPSYWTATTNTYIPNNINYVEPTNWAHSGKLIPIVTWLEDSFEYNGTSPKLPNFYCNVPGATVSLKDELVVLEKKAGTHTSFIPATFSKDGKTYNFEIGYTYTISKATLKIKASAATREYGEENPIFDLSYYGLIGNDTPESFNPAIIGYSNADKMSEVGDYDILLNVETTTNYNITFESAKLTITKAPLKIVVNNVTREYGLQNPEISASYVGLKNGETIPVCSETNVFFTDANNTSPVGNYVIDFIGTPINYSITKNIGGVLSITPAPLLLKASNLEREYFEENPQFDFSITGLRNGDTKTCVTTLPSYNCEANILSDVGVYEIVPSDAVAKNYIFEYVPGNLSINKRQLTANVGNYSRVYGENNPKFEVTYSGFINNEDASVLLQSATISCTADSLSDVGSYPIEISGGEAKNYQISKYFFGTLTITKANQNIIWDQDLSNIDLYSQIELQATSDANLPVTYEMSPNNVATIYNNAGKWYLDCYGSGAVNIRAIQNGDKNHNAAAIITKTLVVFGGRDDPSNPQIYLNVEDPGTLPTMIAENRKYQIKNLRLTGYLNGTDINYIREMCGSDSYGNSTVGVLETLDISGCTIVSGGRSYYQSNRTSDNIVGNYMFYNCKVLTTLSIPNNTTSLGDYAFADCERLSTISLSNSVKSFGVQSFRNNISLQRLSLPNELEIIGDMAFLGCTGLTEITIPSSVTYIGSGITKECQNLARIVVEAGNAQYASSDGVLYNSALNELMAFPISYSESEYMVPNGVVKISPYAFENAKDLKSVSLPASLLSIGQDAFIGCVNLTNLQVQALNPPTCQNDCFDNISKTRCELQVPIGCRSYYWVAPVWSEFSKIVETDFSGISNVNYDDVQVEIVNGKIKISGCPGNLIVRIYHINGTLVYQELAQSNIIQFEPSSIGIYLVVIGNKTYKRLFKFY